MPSRELLADEFLDALRWYFAEDRERTRRVARDFLLERPEEQFSRLMLDTGVIVVATAERLVTTSVPFNAALVNIPPGCSRFGCHFQVVHLGPAIERYSDSALRAMVFETLTQAFAVVGGLDEARAIQVAAEAGREAARPAAWRKN